MFTFSTTVFDVLWEMLDLPAMPVRLAVDRHGATPHARESVRALALAEAEQRGLGGWPNLDHRLADLLDLLARHDRAVDLRELGDRRRTALAAASGSHGALAAIEGELVTVSAINGDRFVLELLGLLPALPPGPGRTCSAPAGVLERAMKALADSTDSHQARAVLRPAGISGGDIEQLLRIARGTISSGSIGAYRGSRGGSYGAARLVGSLAYLDTAQGRYLVLQRKDQSRQPYTTVIPVDLNGLHRHIHELLGLATRW